MSVACGWYRDTQYAAGGKKLPKPEQQGILIVNEDGTLDVCPDDDYYGGKISAADARGLALEILARTGGTS